MSGLVIGVKMEEYPPNTFLGSLRKARGEIGMALIRIGASIAIKNNEKLKIYMKQGGKVELLGELEKKKSEDEK